MAKSKKTLKVDPVGLHKLMAHFRGLEKDNGAMSINGMPVSAFINSISDIETSAVSISVRVKIAILQVNGENNPDPSTLPDDTKMSDFNFGDIQNIELAKRLTKIARATNPAGKVTPGDVEDCEKVDDVIDVTVKAS